MTKPANGGALPSPTIRPARKNDAEAMREIYNEAVRTTTATFDTELRSVRAQRAWFGEHDARHPVLVAELGRSVVGWGSLSPWSDRKAYDGTAESSVYVGSRWRGRGVGRALVSAILREATRCSFHTILARVVVGNPVSRALHVSAGFEPVGVMHEVGYKFNQFLDVELLELRVRPLPEHSRGTRDETRPKPSS